MTLTLVPAGAAQRHTLIKGDVIADLSGLPDHNAHAVIDKETPANFRAGMNLNAGHPTANVRHHAR